MFFGGFATVAVRFAGPNKTARVNGTANLENASAASFVGASRITLDRLQGRILFSSDQAQIDQLTGYLGGGKFVASGGALFGTGLSIDSLPDRAHGYEHHGAVPRRFHNYRRCETRDIGPPHPKRVDQPGCRQHHCPPRPVHTRYRPCKHCRSTPRTSISSGSSSGFATQVRLTIEGAMHWSSETMWRTLPLRHRCE